jgi:hypothetical protein
MDSALDNRYSLTHDGLGRLITAAQCLQSLAHVARAILQQHQRNRAILLRGQIVRHLSSIDHRLAADFIRG